MRQVQFKSSYKGSESCFKAEANRKLVETGGSARCSHVGPGACSQGSSPLAPQGGILQSEILPGEKQMETEAESSSLRGLVRGRDSPLPSRLVLACPRRSWVSGHARSSGSTTCLG